MHRRTRPLLAAALAAGLALIGAAPASALAAPAAASAPVDATITVPRVENLSDDFIGGVDVSSVLSLEASGVVFRHADGTPDDLFAILADSGVTDVRVRVWNDPFDADGNGYGGGDVDVDRALEIAKRATDAGLGVLVDFQYSDFWADPAKQQAPKAWTGLTADETAAAVGTFTRDAVHRLVEAGVDLKMVQIGNETNNGVAGVSGWDDMAAVFSAGSAAVRAESPGTLVALHFTNPERAGFYAGVAAQLDSRGVDYDVFASSYYPFWHGSTANLTAVLSQIARTYGKKVMVAETSWAYTLEDGDGHGNVIDLPGEATQYPISVQGQASAVRDVVQAVADVGDAGIGVFYWEPAWLPVGPPAQLDRNRVLWERDGSGWASSFAGEYDPDDAGQWYGGSAWDNQALFSFDGTASDALDIFRYVRTGAIAPREVETVEPAVLQFTEGDAVALPDEVTVRYTDGTSEQQQVIWSDVARYIEGVGSYEIAGTTSAGLTASASVTVSPRNFLRNPGFEDADTSMWTKTGAALTLRAWDDPHGGVNSAHFYAASAYSFELSQTVTGLPAGSYFARGVAQGDGEGDSGTVSLSLSGGAPVAFGLEGWRTWSSPTTEPVEVDDDGTLTVSVTASLPGGAWGTLDDFELVRATDAGADTSALRTLRDDAAAVDPALYEASSLGLLAPAIARADIVLQAAAPSIVAVEGAAAQLREALDALVALPAAAISLDASSVVAGGSVTVTGSGFMPGGGLRIELHSDPVRLGTVAVGADGTFRTTLAIPAATAAGAHEIVVIGEGVEASAALTVTTAASGAVSAEGLAATGADGAPLAIAGGILCFLGLVLVAMRRHAVRQESGCSGIRPSRRRYGARDQAGSRWGGPLNDLALKQRPSPGSRPD